MWRIATLEVLSVLTFHVLVGESKKWAALILVFLWTWIVYIHCVRVPYLGAVHARMRSAIAGALCFAFCCVAALTDGRSSVEMVLAAGSLPAAALAFWLTSLRQSRARRLLDKFWALREAVASGNGRKLHKFDDHEALEVSVRIARPPGFRCLPVSVVSRRLPPSLPFPCRLVTLSFLAFLPSPCPLHTPLPPTPSPT